MKKLLLVLGLSVLFIGNQSFVTLSNEPTNTCIVSDGEEVTFKIKNDSGSGIRLQFKGSGGDSGTMSMNSNITTEFKKAEGCKVYDYDSGKLLFEVTSKMDGTTVKISDYL